MDNEPTALLYTTAPAEYDGGLTRTLRVAGHDRSGQAVREVALPADDIDWQACRYGSGMYLTLDANGWAKHVALGMARAA